MGSRLSYPAGNVIPGPGDIVIGGTGGPTTMPIPFALRGNTVCALGDSITAAGGGANNGGGDGYFWLTSLLTGGKCYPLGFNGVPGNTTAQMLARVGDIIAQKPVACFVLGGTNDIGGSGYSLAATGANLNAIYDALLGAGILPIPIPTLPKTGYVSQATTLANWTVLNAVKRGLPVGDVRDIVFDPATGDWKAGYSSDGTHPTPATAQLIAARLATLVAPLFPAAQSPLPVSNVNGASLLANGFFLTDANSDGMADGWYAYGGASTNSLVAGTGSVLGNWQQIVATTTTQVVYEQDMAAGASAGDVLELAIRFKTANFQANNATAQIKAFNIPGLDLFHIASDIPDATLVRRGVCSTTNNFSIVILLNGPGTLSLAQASLRNLTALGLA